MESVFGFSVGDFITGPYLLHKFVTALHDADVAKSLYSYTIIGLENNQKLLRIVQGFEYTETSPKNAETLTRTSVPSPAYYNSEEDREV